MAGNKLKFGIAVGLILITVGWLGFTGFREGRSYYVSLEELFNMGQTAYDTKLRVAGEVEKGSIKHSESEIQFLITQNDMRLKVTYVGIDPVPDTFKEGAQAVLEGIYQKNGEFRADFIQAKCTSKYEAKYNK